MKKMFDKEKRDRIADTFSPLLTVSDPVHGIGHVRRVESLAFEIGTAEGADMETVLTAAWLHDIGDSVGYDGPRNKASLFNADRAAEILAGQGMDQRRIEAVHHAIHAHSFSAGVPPKTLEAMVLRDADRVDAIGAIGILRWAMYSARVENGVLAHPTDPFGKGRALDDTKWQLDHIRVKLLTLSDGLLTATGKDLGRGRHEVVQNFLDQLEREWR